MAAASGNLSVAGSTDVITFSYFDDLSSLFPGDPAIELLICLMPPNYLSDARSDSSYSSAKLVLYLVTGLLHRGGRFGGKNT